jgi:hypothetical protein
LIITAQAKPTPTKAQSYFELLPGKPIDLQINQPTVVLLGF